MAEVNLTSFYKFLNGYDNWQETCDTNFGNDDGVVIKKEFKEFAKAEWNGEETLTDDLINKFWKQIDTQSSGKIQNDNGKKLSNGNALNKKELENLEKRLEAYQQLDEFLDENDLNQAPSFLGSQGAKWKNDIAVELSKVVEKYIAGGFNGDLNEMLAKEMPAIANKTTAEYAAVAYQETLKNGVLKDYPDYKIADDATLNKLIDSCLENLMKSEGYENGDLIDADTINNAIKSLIDAYLKTAEIGNGSEYNLGFGENTAVTDLQKVALKQEAKKNMEALRKQNPKFETQFDKALEKYIDRISNEGNAINFAVLKGKMTESEFQTSKEFKDFKNLVTIDTNYANFTSDSSFAEALSKAVEVSSLADILIADAKYIKAYQDIIADVIEKVDAGEFIDKDGNLNTEAVENYIIEQVKANLNEILGGDLGDLSVEELYTAYDKLRESANAQEDPDEGWKQHKEAAITYCDAIAKKGGKFKTAIEDVFGSSDYKSAINKMRPSQIKAKVDELHDAVKDITNVDKLTGEFKASETIPSIYVGGKTTVAISPTWKEEGKDGTPTVYVEKYDPRVVTGSADVEMDANGNLTVTGKQPGTVEIAIYATVDGKEIKLNGTVKVEVKTAETVKTDSSGNKSLESTTLNQASGRFRTELHRPMIDARTPAITILTGIVEDLYNGVVKEGFDAQKAEIAKTSTINYFTALINTLTDKSGADHGDHKYTTSSFTYIDGNGKSKTVTGQNYLHVQCYKDSQVDRYVNGDKTDDAVFYNTDKCGIGIIESFASPSEWAIVIDKKAVADKFKEFLIEALS